MLRLLLLAGFSIASNIASAADQSPTVYQLPVGRFMEVTQAAPDINKVSVVTSSKGCVAFLGETPEGEVVVSMPKDEQGHMVCLHKDM